MTYLLIYFSIALVVAVVAFVLGRVFKERLLGGGILVKAWNSMLIGVFWPVFLLALVVGKCYDLLQTFRKI